MSYTFTTRLGLTALLVAELSHASAETASARVPLTTASVSVALQGIGFNVCPAQIELPLQLTTESATPDLHVVSAELVNSNHLRVRLTCENSRNCLPFFALVKLDPNHLNLSLIAASTSGFPPAPQVKAEETNALRAGQHATLFMEDEHMRISFPVISIDSGAIGKDVRVSSLDRKLTYQAKVVSAQVVRGNLP